MEIPFILLTQHNILPLEATLGCTVLETVNREDPSQQSVLLVTKATTIAYKTQKVTSYIISNAFVWKGGSMEPMEPPLDTPLFHMIVLYMHPLRPE